MKSLVVGLLLASFLVLSGTAFAVSPPNTTPISLTSFNETSTGISNFSVEVHDQTVMVFRYVNVSSPSSLLNSLYGRQDQATSFGWHGTGNISIVSALTTSVVRTFFYESTEVQYAYVYNSNFLGILFTSGNMTEENDEILISSSAPGQVVSMGYITSPVSFYSISQNSYVGTGDSYSGSHSYFYYSPGELQNFSLSNEYSSVSIISDIKMYGGNGNQFGLSLSDLIDSNGSTVLASDGLFPFIYLSGFDASLTLDLSDGFQFVPAGTQSPIEYRTSGMNIYSRNLPSYIEHFYRIENANRVVGYIEVFGNGTINASSLSINSSTYFIVLRFFPAFQAIHDDDMTNATMGIFVSNHATFVPLSANITSQFLNFENGTLTFQYLENESGKVVVVFEGNYSISSFYLSGSGSVTTTYSIGRQGNETVVTFLSNGSGQKTLSLSVLPITSRGTSQLLSLVVVSAAMLVVVTLALILYSRKRWSEKLEKG